MAEKVNLNPGDFAEGGGLIDDFDGVISDIRFIMTDYDGAIPDAVPCAKVIFNVDGDDTEASLYSVGGKDDFTPDDSGMGLIKLKSKNSLTKKAKFSMLLASLVEAGFPLNKMDGENISYLVGLSGHFERKAVDYKGLKTKGDRETTVLLCTKIDKLPWEQVKGKTGAKGSKVAPKVDEALGENLAGIIQGIVILGDGAVAKKTVLSTLFKHEDITAMSTADKKAALKLATNDAYLKERDEWAYEDGVLKIG